MNKLLLLLLLFFSGALQSQVCTNLGQNPGTAFPVCGSSTFKQTTVDICGTRVVPAPCNQPGIQFEDKNPYWYKFTCFREGTLGFEITPVNLQDDYDWQLFDVTGKDPQNVYTDASMFVACNWTGETGITGASAAGSSLTVCGGGGFPLFSSMPPLIQGHSYILLISHFTNSQSGYSLSFGGGTASITDTVPSNLAAARPNCEGRVISIKLNKNATCVSLAGNGSDFSISPGASTIIRAEGVNCSNGFDMDSLILTLDNPLPTGTYTITTKTGTDGNTLLDYCDTQMAVGLSATFIMKSLEPTPFDSIRPVGCSPDTLNLVFSKPILCSSIAANGSDFTINASSGVTVTSAEGVCTNNLTGLIKLKLSGPVYKGGTHTVTLTAGTDGNTILDECTKQTPAGSSATFVTADTVSANFAYRIDFGCKADTISFFNDGNIGINKWAWKFNDRATSSQQNPVYIYSTFGQQQVKLSVTNGVCTDSTTTSFILDNELDARFAGPDLLCPEDPAVFRDSSIGKINTWNWDFGNGVTSNIQQPEIQQYLPVTTNQNYLVKLVVRNDHNCLDTAYKQLKVLNNCYIGVPTAFTPNGDGLNDQLYPMNAFKARGLQFRIYNRLGQLVFETEDFTNKWDGTYKGVPQASGTYVWTLQYTHVDTGRLFSSKGTSVLIR